MIEKYDCNFSNRKQIDLPFGTRKVIRQFHQIKWGRFLFNAGSYMEPYLERNIKEMKRKISALHMLPLKIHICLNSCFKAATSRREGKAVSVVFSRVKLDLLALLVMHQPWQEDDRGLAHKVCKCNVK